MTEARIGRGTHLAEVRHRAKRLPLSSNLAQIRSHTWSVEQSYKVRMTNMVHLPTLAKDVWVAGASLPVYVHRVTWQVQQRRARQVLRISFCLITRHRQASEIHCPVLLEGALPRATRGQSSLLSRGAMLVRLSLYKVVSDDDKIHLWRVRAVIDDVLTGCTCSQA